LCKRNRQPCKDLGATKAFIVSGRSRHGEELAREIYKILEKAGLETIIFAGADPNPTDTSAMEGANIYRKEGCNIIISAGEARWTVPRLLVL
jgi:alcohol dehydrogenase